MDEQDGQDESIHCLLFFILSILFIHVKFPLALLVAAGNLVLK
jgi:hypothetical protein